MNEQHNCFLVCGLSNQWIWDLIFVIITPLLQLNLASSLSLEVGYLLCRFHCFFIDDYLEVICDFGAFVRKG